MVGLSQSLISLHCECVSSLTTLAYGAQIPANGPVNYASTFDLRAIGMRTQSRGFTQIELAVVVAVMMLLAAFAIPRFTAIENEGRVSAVASLSASIRNASALAHAQWLASGRPETIDVEGQTVTMRNGYPDAGQTGLPAALPDAAGFSATLTGDAVVYRKYGAPQPDHCAVVYSPPASPGIPPKILLYTPNLSGC